MKILVPTDFSEVAGYAIETAILFAKKLEAEIHLYHSANVPDDWEDLPADVRYQDELNKNIAIKARSKLQDLQRRIKKEGIACQYHYTGGKFIQNITEITDKIDFDLIIMGSHGASGKEEWFMGSNAQKVVRKVRNQIIVVKNQMRTLAFGDVLFVSGLDQEDQEAFRKFLDFITPFNVDKVHVMTVDTSAFFSQPAVIIKSALKDFEQIAEGFDVSTHFYSDYSIDSGVRHFCEDFDIGLVGISNHAKRPIKRLFVGSNVEMIVNHSKVPVLSIDY